jgi:hypothetical protein
MDKSESSPVETEPRHERRKVAPFVKFGLTYTLIVLGFCLIPGAATWGLRIAGGIIIFSLLVILCKLIVERFR